MRLRHLTAVGADVPPASIEFAPRLTVIYGASEAGKSYIIEAIDYLLGASALRDLPEARGYSDMLLGIELDDASVVTLARSLRGGRIRVYEEDLRTSPDRPSDRTLLAQHSQKNPDNISRYILEELGIADAQLRKNQRNVLQALSLRNIAHLCLVDDEQMHSKTSPVESGLVTARTAELSAFKLLVEGVDDSGLATGEDPGEFKRVNRGQLVVLERAITQIRSQVDEKPERPALVGQLARLNQSIIELSSSLEGRLLSRNRLMARRGEAEAALLRNQRRHKDAQTTRARFQLLDEQYASDLARLAMVKEAGTFLGYFDAEACVFCGANPEDQHRKHAVWETVNLAESVGAEARKTAALKEDLAVTISALAREESGAEQDISSYSSILAQTLAEIAALDQQLEPSQNQLGLLLESKSESERLIGLWDRVGELESLRDSVARESPTAVDRVDSGISSDTKERFSDTLRQILISWQIPGAADSYFTFEGRPDVVLGQRRRSDRGRGMRSILHAGFSVSLAGYCLERELPHPGFLALDTPVLTYRDPDKEFEDAATEAELELMTPSVARAFYSYLQDSQLGQVIVVENQTPPEVSGDGCNVVYFSGTQGKDRSGFYPEP